MGPEDNPADDIQPTKEEWEAVVRGRDTFYIEFSTEDGPGILATKVVLTSEYVHDISSSFNIALAGHPLYKKLEQYVLANPSD